jgi:N-acetylglutamate synthase-like GNAT family acetyltransferase
LNSADLHIRKALVSDAPALKICIEAAYKAYFDRISDLPPVSDGITGDITDNQVWLGIEGDTIIAGHILVTSPDHLKVANLAVHPDHGGKGVGHKLMQHSENEARRQGYDEMRLNTHIAMPENVQLYKYWGWQVTARNENTVSMKKTLDSL